MLTCHVSTSHPVSIPLESSAYTLSLSKGNCNKDNFPLVFTDVELVIRESPENLDFIQRFLPKLDWSALVDTARSVSPEVSRIYTC